MSKPKTSLEMLLSRAYVYVSYGFWVMLFSIYNNCVLQGQNLEEFGYDKIFVFVVILLGLIFLLNKYGFLSPSWIETELPIKILALGKYCLSLVYFSFAMMFIFDLVTHDGHLMVLFVEFFCFACFFVLSIFVARIIIPVVKTEIFRKKAHNISQLKK